MDSLNNQYAIVRFFHFSEYFSGKFSLVCFDFAHLQRAAKCADQSTGNCPHQVIDCRSMRLGNIGGIDAVVGCNGSVNTKGSTAAAATTAVDIYLSLNRRSEYL